MIQNVSKSEEAGEDAGEASDVTIEHERAVSSPPSIQASPFLSVLNATELTSVRLY